MEPTQIALFGSVVLVCLLLMSIAIHRSFLTLTGARAANQFSPGGEEVSAFATRLARAHANCYEFLPFALATMLYAIANNSTELTNPLALAFLIARLLQTSTHLISTAVIAVLLRFGFFLVQVLIVLHWIWQLAGL